VVTIQIFAEPGNGSSERVGKFTVEDFQQCIEYMKNTWIKCNVSSEIYEFRVIASTPYFKNGHGGDSFELGKYVIPRRSTKVEIFATDSDESNEAFDNQGFSIEQQQKLSEQDLFKARFHFLLNPNNHHRLIGKWLRYLDDDLDLENIVETSNGLLEVTDLLIGKSVLASLLTFANVHGKKSEMLQWLASKEGSLYLTNFDSTNTIAALLLKASKDAHKAINNQSASVSFIDDYLGSHLIKEIPLPDLITHVDPTISNQASPSLAGIGSVVNRPRF